MRFYTFLKMMPFNVCLGNLSKTTTTTNCSHQLVKQKKKKEKKCNNLDLKKSARKSKRNNLIHIYIHILKRNSTYLHFVVYYYLTYLFEYTPRGSFFKKKSEHYIYLYNYNFLYVEIDECGSFVGLVYINYTIKGSWGIQNTYYICIGILKYMPFWSKC